MAHSLDMTDRTPVLAMRPNEEPEVWILSGRDAGVWLMEGGRRRQKLGSYYSQKLGRWPARRRMGYHLRSPGLYLACSYGGSYGMRKLVLARPHDDRVLELVGEFAGVAEAMRAAGGGSMARRSHSLKGAW